MMDLTTTTKKPLQENRLDRLSRLDRDIESLEHLYNTSLRAILSPDQCRALDKLNNERDYQSALLKKERAQLESSIRGQVLETGQSLKGTVLQATYTQGRISWDSKGLHGYSVAHPEILTFKSHGKPFVTIRPLVVRQDELDSNY